MKKPIITFISILIFIFLLIYTTINNTMLAFWIFISLSLIGLALCVWGVVMTIFDREFNGKKHEN